MQIKKFDAKDMKEGLEQVKREFGSDAMIVATRQIKAPGLFGGTRLEITAALDGTAAHVGERAMMEPMTPDLGAKLESLRSDLRTLRTTLFTQDRGLDTEALKQEIIELRRLLYTRTTTARNDNDLFENILEAADIEAEYAERLASAARRLENGTKQSSWRTTTERCAGILATVVATSLKSSKAFTAKKRNIVAIVGPTGVGKTTSLVKLAAQAALVRRERVLLATADTYRLGAVEELRHYAELIGVPVAVVHDRKDFQDALRQHSECSLVLLDTAGRSPGDTEQMAGLQDIFSTDGIHVLLAVAAFTRKMEIRQIVRRYLPLDPRGLIFTKLDEAVILGCLVNATSATGLPIAYTTFGQKIPEDIATADVDALARQLVLSAFHASGIDIEPQEPGAPKDITHDGAQPWN